MFPHVDLLEPYTYIPHTHYLRTRAVVGDDNGMDAQERIDAQDWMEEVRTVNLRVDSILCYVDSY